MNRRQVLRTAGIATTGCLSLSSTGSGAVESGPSVDVETNPLEGAARSAVVRRARESPQIEYVTEQLGERRSVAEAVEYTVGSDTGLKVQFGMKDSPNPLIKYYRSDALPDTGVDSRGADDVVAIGTMTLGDGIRVVDGARSTVVDIMETQAVREVQSGLRDNDAFRRRTDRIERRPEKFDLRTDRPRLVRDPTRDDDQFVYLLPVTKDGDFHKFIRATGTDPATADVRLDPSPSGGHVSCYRGICADWCLIICGALGSAGAIGCGAACLAAVATAPISPGCGLLCGAVVTGVCYPTCTNRVH
ncbi:hypothetical protein [Natronorubrum sp. DTA7]|uniref:hypothetical protein n=1 Tax=Natronorubrum sp. DTA7 TaxID=3447016 RepID=UPI003F8694DF